MKIYNPDIQYVGVPVGDLNSHIFKITPEMFLGSDVFRINQAIDFVSERGFGEVVCNGSYLLDSAIIIKSNLTLINNGLIKMNNSARDNIIRAAVASTTPISNIKIDGSGIFQGGDSSWGSDTPADVGSESWRAIGILLANVVNFEIKNITLKNTAMWGICLEQSRYGKLNNLTILQDNSKPNQDGVNIRRGSHNIMVDGIYGVCFDDTLAITNLNIRNDVNFLGSTIYENSRTDFNIYQIIAKNINRPQFVGQIGSYSPPVKYGGILLLCEDGNKIHDVFIDGILGEAQVNVAFTQINYAENTQANVNDMFNINISNVATAAVFVNRPIKNSSIINVPALNIQGTFASAIFKAGSSNVMRKYHNGNFEFFATV